MRPKRFATQRVANLFTGEGKLERKLIHDNVACRKGKGTHYGLNRLGHFMREHYNRHGAEGYILKGDISSDFGSIDHEILKKILRLHIQENSEKRLLTLLDSIIDSTKGKTGLPLGNMTSQWFGLLYLDPLDRYVRYVDDWILVHESKNDLKECLREIQNLLEEKLKLRLNPKTQIIPIKNAVDFFGIPHLSYKKG